MTVATEVSATQVITGKVRLSYVNIFKPRKSDDGDEKYSVMLLIPKSDKKTVKAILAAIEAAKEAGRTSKFGGKIPKNLKITFRDGDEERDTDDQPEYEGHYFMNVSSNRQPGIVDRRLRPIIDPTAVYSGCYARVEINAAPFNAEGSKGISFYLNNVQFLEDGEPLGGTISKPEDVFTAFDDDDDEDGDEGLL